MPIIEIDVLDGVVDVRVEDYGWSKRFDDSIRTVRRSDGGRAVVDIGGIHRSKPLPPNRATELRRVFDERHFDPDMAVAFVRYCSITWLNDLGVARAFPTSFRPRHVRLDWPAWSALEPDSRRAFLDSVASVVSSLSINGRTAVSKPLYRRALNLGPRLEPDG